MFKYLFATLAVVTLSAVSLAAQHGVLFLAVHEAMQGVR